MAHCECPRLGQRPRGPGRGERTDSDRFDLPGSGRGSAETLRPLVPRENVSTSDEGNVERRKLRCHVISPVPFYPSARQPARDFRLLLAVSTISVCTARCDASRRAITEANRRRYYATLAIVRENIAHGRRYGPRGKYNGPRSVDLEQVSVPRSTAFAGAVGRRGVTCLNPTLPTFAMRTSRCIYINITTAKVRKKIKSHLL